METQRTQEMQGTQNTQEKMPVQAKSTKSRLDELTELHNGGYITEFEFKTARVNILKEGGMDVTTRQQQYAHRPAYREEEEDSKSSGCGCFLMMLLLAFLVLGVSFFAAPYWPERFGGATAMAAREWATDRGMELRDRFFGEPAPLIHHVPDPIPVPAPPEDERREEDPSNAIEPEPSYYVPEAVQPEDGESAIIPPAPPLPVTPRAETGGIALPSLDTHILSLPLGTAEANPLTTEADPQIVETGVSAAETPISAPVAEPVPENPIRGRVTAANVRVRSTPDIATNNNVVGWAREGDRFTVLEEGTGRDGSRWFYVVYDTGNRRGWTSGSLVRLENR